MTKYVATWFARADEDIIVAELVLKENGPPNQICFHAQQIAEKYLKGFLAFHEKHIRKIHDLDSFIVACKEIDPSFEEIHGDASYLTQLYIEGRYPGDFPEFGQEDARKAYKAALRVKEFVLIKIKS